MEDVTNYKPGDKVLKAGAYWGKCPTCGTEFMGRKNRVYCSEKCKIRKNNDRASQRRNQHGPMFLEIARNIRILEKFYPLSMGSKALQLSDLEREGFIRTSFSKLVKFLNYSGTWQVIGDYAFHINENQTVLVQRVKK